MFEILARFLVLAAEECPAHAPRNAVVGARCVNVDQVGASLTCLGNVGSIAHWELVEN